MAAPRARARRGASPRRSRSAQSGRALGDDLLDHAPTPPRPMRAGRAPANTHAWPSLVGMTPGAGVRPEHPLVAVGLEVGPVAVDDAAPGARRRGRTARRRARRRSSGCRRRRSPAGACSSTRAAVAGRGMRRRRPGRRATGGRSPTCRDAHSAPASMAARDEDRVEHGAARRVEGVDAVRRA